MAGSLRRGAGFKKGHRKLHAMSVPIYKTLLFNEFDCCQRTFPRKVYAMLRETDLILSKGKT
ncbi:MAG: hypothetical protein AAAB11_19930 [Rhizobium giardinii]